MTLDEFYDFITKHMTPEEALRKLLATQMDHFEKLKIAEGDMASPYFIVANAAMDLGWSMIIEKNVKYVEGIVIGTDAFLERMVKSERIPKVPES